MLTKIETALTQLRQTKPLVLCLTNYVTMDFMANSLLALGAAPIMSHDASELAELIKISSAVNINIGTLTTEFIERSMLAAELAQRYAKPIILDPVGVGASQIRTRTARELLPFVDIVRGNASEIMALLEDQYKTLGVEATHQVSDAKTSAQKLALNHRCTVVVSGAEDFISNGHQQESLQVGSALMPLVTGMGCTLTSVVAAFRAVVPDAWQAALFATAYFGLCGNVAALTAHKPAAFRSAFIDALYTADFQAMESFCKIA